MSVLEARSTDRLKERLHSLQGGSDVPLTVYPSNAHEARLFRTGRDAGGRSCRAHPADVWSGIERCMGTGDLQRGLVDPVDRLERRYAFTGLFHQFAVPG